MSVGFTVPTGIACDDCTATEQDCARNYPCCTECSHFADPEQPLDLTPDRPPRRPEQPMTTPTPLTRDTLAEARKKLRGGARPVAASAHGTPCGKGCGRTFTSTGWRTKHEADCTGAA